MLEAVVEAYFVKKAEQECFLVRKLKFIGVCGAPDRAIMRDGQIWFVELKRPKGGVHSVRQQRESFVLRAAGMSVHLLHTIAAIDEFFEELRRVRG